MVAVKKTGGRVKGTPNKNTAQIRDMIIEALDRKGGVDYLAEQAGVNPVTFMGLLGKVMPTQVSGVDGEPIQVEHGVSEAVQDIIRQIKDESC